MSQISEKNLALFIDFDNVALGARDAHQRFDVQVLLQRVLEKGKIIVKRAYADWRHYKEHLPSLHEAAIEMIEIPTPKISGKNSADIRLVVDAMDLCYSKEHVNTFVIVSGDSDFSPLVSKLRENNKEVIGIGVRNATSNLLVSNCDEFLFYDDIYSGAADKLDENLANVPPPQRELFDFLLTTTQGLLQETRGVLYSSLIKDTMKRKQPDFSEAKYGYSTFGDLLDDAKRYGLLSVERDARAGGTWVVQGLGAGRGTAGGRASGRSSRRSRRRRDHDRNGRGDERDAARAGSDQVTAERGEDAAIRAASAAAEENGGEAREVHGEATTGKPTGARGRRRSRRKRSKRPAEPAAARGPAANGAERPTAGQPAPDSEAAAERAPDALVFEPQSPPPAEVTETKTAKKKAAKKTAKKKTAKKTAKKKAAKKAAEKNETAAPPAAIIPVLNPGNDRS
jgi:uncharacterized protein (TIGR00288 family)